MFYTLTKMFVYKLLLRVSQNSGHYLFFYLGLFSAAIADKEISVNRAGAK